MKKNHYELISGVCNIWKSKLLKRMRIVALLIVMTVTQTFALDAYAQYKRLSLDLQDETIINILDKIESQSEFYFMYDASRINVNQVKSVNCKSQLIKDIFDQLFENTGIAYSINDRQVLLTAIDKSEAVQQKSISGKVVDSSGLPLPGVTVVVKGTTQGTVTNVDGEYSLPDVPTDAVLQFSFVGMRTQEVSVAGQSIINVTLMEGTIGIDEVIAVGYGTQKKVNLTGSVAALESSELSNKPVATTSQALAGLVPGLSVVQNSGRPGTSATVKIRGTGTFSSAGNDPLVLIDGMAGSIDDVNPEDVESISFLKDAASASIYGNRAANGVILIQTKRGKVGKFTVSYNNSLGWQKPTETPDFLPSWEYATYYNEAMENMGNAPAYSAEQIQKYKDGSDPDNYPNVNHLEWLINSGSGFQQRHTLSIQGGNERISQNLSIGYLKQNGMTAETSNERYNVLWNATSNLLEKLTLDTHLSAYANTFKSPNGEPTSIDGMVGYTVREGPIYAGQKSNGSFGYQDNYSPEAWLASESFIKNDNVNVKGLMQLSWDTPVKGLTLVGKSGITYNSNYNKSYRANTVFDASKTVGPASLSVNSGNSTYKTFDGLLKYKKTFDLHDINLMAGTSLETYKNNSLTGYRNSFPNNYLYELTSGSAASSTNDGSSSEWALLSYFGRLNYSWADRYLLEMNVRYDGSSRFASDTRWGFFPSVSAGWRISEENFWKNSGLSNIFDFLKLRGSWGILGNQNIGTYPYQQTYSLGQNAVWGNPGMLISGARITTFNNPEITWETTRITDFGIDFSLWNGKLNGVFDYFDKYTNDILSAVQVTNIMGRSVGQSNVGAVSNKGIEFNLEFNGKIGNSFNYSLSPNFTYVKNSVEELADGALKDINNNRIVGEPLGIIYGYRTNGLFVDQDEIDSAPTQLVNGVNPGYIRFEDISGPDGVPDGIVNANYDRSVIGSTTPKFYYGMNINASYKGFDFSALLQGLGGHQRLIGSYMAYAFFNGGQIQRWQVDNRWTTENPDKWAKYPRLESLNANHTNNQVSTYWLRNASYLRIKNVQIGYNFPKQLLDQFGIQSLRLFVSGQNLYSFNSFYKGWDPENEIAANDWPSYYPVNSVYSIGVNVKF